MTFFGNKMLPGTKLVYTGIGLFGVSLTLAATDIMFMLGTMPTVTVLSYLQLYGILVCTVRITTVAMHQVERNKWLTILGITGIIASTYTGVLYGAVPLLEIWLGGTGHMDFERIGFNLDTWQVVPIALTILLISIYTLVLSLNLFVGQSRFQR